MSTTTETTVQKAPKVKRVHSISKVDLNVAKGAVMAQACRDLKIEGIDGTETDEQLTVFLAGHFEANCEKDDLAVCDECGGKSDTALAACPYCGSEGLDEAPAQAPPAASGKVVAAPAEVPAAAVVDDKPKLANAVPKGKKEAAMQTQENGMALAGGGSGSKMATASLDRAVEEAKVLQRDTVINYAKLGQLVSKIRDTGLWKQRINGETGKAAYKTFEAFCNAELHMSPTHALNCMGVAKEYSDEQIRRLGIAKLSLVLRAPEPERKALLEKVERGATKKETAEAVKKAKKAHGAKPKPQQAKALAKRQEKAAAKAKVTVVDMVGRQAVKLYEKPTTKEYDFKDLKRAKKIGDQPFGVHELVNGVRQEFTVRANAAGEWELVINTVRVDD